MKSVIDYNKRRDFRFEIGHHRKITNESTVAIIHPRNRVKLTTNCIRLLFRMEVRSRTTNAIPENLVPAKAYPLLLQNEAQISPVRRSSFKIGPDNVLEATESLN